MARLRCGARPCGRRALCAMVSCGLGVPRIQPGILPLARLSRSAVGQDRPRGGGRLRRVRHARGMRPLPRGAHGERAGSGNRSGSVKGADMDNRKLTSQELEELAAWARRAWTCWLLGRTSSSRARTASAARSAARCWKAQRSTWGWWRRATGASWRLPPASATAAVLQLVNDRPDVLSGAAALLLLRLLHGGVPTPRAGRRPACATGASCSCRPASCRPTTPSWSWLTTSGHIFSAYRAIYGVGYPEFVSLAQAAEHGPGLADTVFFPGCSLVSYAPELTRKVGRWLTAAGVSWALSDDCCGSPLMSAGLFDRAAALRGRILEQMRAAGRHAHAHSVPRLRRGIRAGVRRRGGHCAPAGVFVGGGRGACRRRRAFPWRASSPAWPAGRQVLRSWRSRVARTRLAEMA